MLFQNAPAMTTNYMIAGYAVIFSVLGVYLISLVVRRNNLKKDLEILNDEQAANTGAQLTKASAQPSSNVADNAANQKS